MGRARRPSRERDRGVAILPRLCIVAASLLFSTGGAAIKLADLGTAQVACFRSGIAALVLLSVSSEARRGLGAAGWRPALRALAVGAAFAATMALYVFANRTTTAANAVFLQATAPLYVLLLGPLLLREAPRRRDLSTMGWMALGMALFFAAPAAPQATAPEPLLGNVLALAAGLTWALTVVGLRWLGRGGEGPLAGVAAGSVLVFALALPFALPVIELGVSDALVLLWLGVFQIALAYLFASAGLRRVTAFEASLLFLIEPVLNPVWAWLVHGERPGALALVGAALILGAGLASTRR